MANPAAGRTAADLYNDLIQYYAKAIAAGQPQVAAEILKFLQTGQSQGLSQPAQLVIASVVRGTPYAQNPSQLVTAARTGPGQAAVPGAPQAPAGSPQRQSQSPVPGNVPEQGITIDPNSNDPVRQLIETNPPGSGTLPGSGNPLAPTKAPGKPITRTPTGGIDISGFDQSGLDMAVDDPGFLADLGLQDAGYDTSKALGIGGNYAERAIGTLAQVLQSVRGFTESGEGLDNPTSAAVQGLVDKLGAYGERGKDFYGGVRTDLMGLLSNPAFMENLSDTDDPAKMANLLADIQGGSLMGANPMVQEAMRNRLKRTLNEYKRAAAVNPEGVGTLIEFIKRLTPEQLARLFPTGVPAGVTK